MNELLLGLGAAGAILTITGSAVAAALWVRNGYQGAVERLEEKFDDRMANATLRFEERLSKELVEARENADRVYAQRADLTRLESRMDSILEAIVDIRATVHRLDESRRNS